ncbi:hypothetical protein V3N99_06050 [Dermatophilaceae bacterium Soc4.6]
MADSKRLGIALMMRGGVAGAVVVLLTSSRWGILGIAVSLVGYTIFATADPADRPPPSS